jgi:UrcA family protein
MHAQNKGSLSLVTLILAFNLVDPAVGQPGHRFDGEHRATVDGAGLDVSRFQDAQVLYGRIRSAAHSVCRAQKALWDVKQALHQRLCIARAVEEAVARANEPLLSAVHRASNERLADR